MVTILLPRSLIALFPSCDRRYELPAEEAPDVAALIRALDARVPGIADRLTEAGPRIRPHINVFVDGEPASISAPVSPSSTVHVIPAVSGG